MVTMSLASKIGENLIINPNFDIWQRGDSFVGITHTSYFADRFAYFANGTVVHDANKSTDVPTISETKYPNTYSAFLNVTTLDAVLDTGVYTYISHKIEGYILRKVAGKNVYMSFWVKATKTGIHCVSFRNQANTKSYITEYTINTTDTWEKKVVRLKHDATGTWDYESDSGVEVLWMLGCGTDFHTTPDEWQDGNFLATANQVNGNDAVNNEFRIAQVQLHEGLDEIPFSKLARDYAEEFQLCQRYYEVLASWGEMGGSAYKGISYPFSVRKRVAPTITGVSANSDLGTSLASTEYGGKVTTVSGGGSYLYVSGGVADAEL